MFRRTHYSLATNPAELLAWSRAARTVAQQLAADKKPALCFTGISGMAHGFALSLELTRNRVEHGLIIVRKEEDRKNHGQRLEVNLHGLAAGYESENFRFEIWSPFLEMYHPIFVDDIISSGDTRMNVINAIQENGSKDFRQRFQAPTRKFMDSILTDEWLAWDCEANCRKQGYFNLDPFREV